MTDAPCLRKFYENMGWDDLAANRRLTLQKKVNDVASVIMPVGTELTVHRYGITDGCKSP